MLSLNSGFANYGVLTGTIQYQKEDFFHLGALPTLQFYQHTKGQFHCTEMQDNEDSQSSGCDIGDIGLQAFHENQIFQSTWREHLGFFQEQTQRSHYCWCFHSVSSKCSHIINNLQLDLDSQASLYLPNFPISVSVFHGNLCPLFLKLVLPIYRPQKPLHSRCHKPLIWTADSTHGL